MRATLPPEQFVACATPEAWCVTAARDLETLLIDHAYCEKKAASTAVALMFRYPDHPALLDKLSRLAREELRHFEQVQKILRARGMVYRRLSASRYAEGLRRVMRSSEPARLVDTLVVGAFIEARSCERFLRLAPHLPPDLGAFYLGLCAAERRHYADYLALAHSVAGAAEVEERVALVRDVERELIETPDRELRFHSGVPAPALN
jgi:tRNA-(ms[2]io[6]A)-hydroxylase